MRKILVLLFALIAMIGCQVVEVTPSFENTVDEVGSSIYYVGMDVDADTKTSLSGKEILWSEGDMMNIFFGANNDKKDKLVLMEGAGTISGSFYGPYIASSDISGDLHQTVIVYPYDENTTCVANEDKNEYTIGLTIPSVQEYSGYSFANGAYPMVGVTENVREVFIKTKNVASIVRLNMKGTDAISRIIVSSDEFSLAGPAKVVASYESDPVATIVKETASNMVRLVCEEPVQLKEDEATPFSIAIAPGTGALKITVIDENGGYKIYNVSSRKYARNGQIEFTISSYKADQNILASIREAFANGGEYTLTADVFLTSPLTLPEGKSLTLNLNGYTISQKMECTESYSMITNYGSLTIQGEGKLSLEDLSNGGGSVWGSYTISNNGTLVVNNGVIEHLGTLDDDHDTSIPIQNYQGTVVINGGTISSPEFRSLRDFTAGGKIEINGGVFNGQVWMQGLGSGSSILTIKGGEFSPCYGYDGSSVYVSNGSNVVNVEITGGTFNTKIGCVDANKEGVKGSISGGTFTESAKLNTNAALLKQGYMFVEENGVYNVVYSAVAEVVYEDQSQTYGCLTLVDAIAKALEDGASVRVVKDILDIDADNTIVIPSGKTLVIDLNGNTVAGVSDQTGSNRNMFDVRGSLTIKNGTVTYKHQGENMGWNSSTNVFNVTAGGVLNINDAAVKNLGGSDMGFCVHLNNWGEVTLNAQNVEFESNYVGIRVFNSGYDMNNVTLNNCSILSGSPCFWIHNYTSADFGNDESKVAAASARLNFSFSNTTVERVNDSKSCVRFGFTDAIYYSDLNMTEVVAGTQSALVWALQNGKNVLLNNDITIENSLAIPVGKTVKLDLNGHDISYQVEGNNASAIFAVFGTLNLVSESEAVISYVAKNPDLQAIPSYATNTITNNGTLVIGENVVVKNESEGGASYAVDNHNNFTLNGGVLLGNRCALRIAKYNNPEVVFVMNSGEVKAKTPAWVQLPGSDSNVAPKISVTINGGTFESTKDTSSEDNDVLYTYSYGNSHANTKLVINGGNFLKGTVSIGAGYKGDAPSIEIKGGKFDYDVVQWLENDESNVIYSANK
ncbi:MAG: hypothetical protein IKW65_06785 [Bacteroidales bacterium]|nr:hypothetical protein [Bacteroidales bacterium]